MNEFAESLLFVALLAMGLGGLYWWAFQTLPGEGWQFIGSTPKRRDGESWAGVNFTWYGFFSATAYAVSTTIYVVLMGAVGVPLYASLLATALILAICAPASNLMTRLLEGKRYGFTIGGASFVGLFATPAAIYFLDEVVGPPMGFHIPLTPALAAMVIVYVLGEGLGRLACISFGCCYGKPVEETRGWVRVVSERFPFVFQGKTKKIAFASQLDGVRVVPVQAMTAVLCGAVALLSIWLYLEGAYLAVIPLGLITSQLWRVYSETFRADFRGNNKITAFQWMAFIGAVLAAAAPWIVPADSTPASLAHGLAAVWTPQAILFLQLTWVSLFAYMGRSMQTGASLSFHVHADRI